MDLKEQLKKKIWGLFVSLDTDSFTHTRIIQLTNSCDNKEVVKKILQELINEKQIMINKKNKNRYERYKDNEA